MSCLTAWRRWILQVVMVLYTLILVAAVVVIGLELNTYKAVTYMWGWSISGLFVLFSLPVSIWTILQHIIHYRKPHLQRREIRIIWMVPIYATTSWFALRFPQAAVYLTPIRQFYEAYVIYNCAVYLQDLLIDVNPHVGEEEDQSSVRLIKLTFPFCCVKPWNMRQFFHRTKHGVLQYAVLQPILTLVSLICWLCGVYKDGVFTFTGAYLYVTIITVCSQVWAIYCLTLFHISMKEELQPLRPLLKLLCIKFVVFVCEWQEVLIEILVATGVLGDQADWLLHNDNQVSAAVQNFIICIEMFFAAVAHCFAFSHRPYVDHSDSSANPGPFFSSLRHMFSVDDVIDDVRDHVSTIGGATSHVFKHNGSSYGSTADREPLIESIKDKTESSSVEVSRSCEQANGDLCVSYQSEPQIASHSNQSESQTINHSNQSESQTTNHSNQSESQTVNLSNQSESQTENCS